jgi:hypothetical protein
MDYPKNGEFWTARVSFLEYGIEIVKILYSPRLNDGAIPLNWNNLNFECLDPYGDELEIPGSYLIEKCNIQ